MCTLITFINYNQQNINVCLGLKKVNIHTDSEYVMNSINNWMPRWEKNGWKTASGAAVKNKEIFMTLQKKIQTMDSVSWVKLINF